ncbi:hypothetical protein DRO33_05695, partial [Candidatus Bathyarchaeota archaeon]
MGEHLSKGLLRPAPVRELLVDLKDLCELTIDLAYSSYLFHSPDLAQEVLELEEHAGDLLLGLEVSLMLAARSPEDATALVPISRAANAPYHELGDVGRSIYYPPYCVGSPGYGHEGRGVLRAPRSEHEAYLKAQ